MQKENLKSDGKEAREQIILKSQQRAKKNPGKETTF